MALCCAMEFFLIIRGFREKFYRNKRFCLVNNDYFLCFCVFLFLRTLAVLDDADAAGVGDGAGFLDIEADAVRGVFGKEGVT